jgi:hypothetical protein
MQILGFQNYILCIKELVPPDVCANIIKEFGHDPAKHPGYALKGTGKTEVNEDKISTELGMPKEGKWKDLHESVHKGVTEAITSYVKQCSALQVHPISWSNYKIKMYEKGKGLFKWHFDALGPGAWSRQLALIIYLNDVSEGGETAFYFQQMKVKPEAGFGILFPPFWTHMHCGNVPVSNDKYIITSFAQFDIKP